VQWIIVFVVTTQHGHIALFFTRKALCMVVFSAKLWL